MSRFQPAKVRRFVSKRPDGSRASAFVVLCGRRCTVLSAINHAGRWRGVVSSHESHNGAHMAKAAHNREVHA